MSLLKIMRQVRRHLEESGRLSYRLLRREFGLDDDALEELIEELVDIQRVAVREDKALAWSADATPSRLGAESPPSPPERDPRSYTPKHLADKILQSKSALEGERKQVTVLFAEVRDRYHLASRPSRVRMRLAHGLEGRIYPLGHLILVVSSHALRQ